MILLGISLADKALKPSANLILELRPQAGSIGIQSDGSLMPGILDAVVTLWKDAGVQECFQRNNEYQLNDSAEYFLENASRIYKEGWLPTDTDVLKARVKTTGISETRFQQQGRQFIVVDVGGQRSERRKWCVTSSPKERVAQLIVRILFSLYSHFKAALLRQW